MRDLSGLISISCRTYLAFWRVGIYLFIEL